LKKDADMVFMEVKRGAIASLSEVPGYFWLVLLLFGFNEIYTFASYVLFNPFLLFLVVILVGTVWFLMKSGLWSPLLSAAYQGAGPLLRTTILSTGPWLANLGELIAETLKEISVKIKDASASKQMPVRRTESPVKSLGGDKNITDDEDEKDD
jgi:hypothetical protein